eukprot:TRINITY_DN4570_c0_g1_i2.p1 TRINITY_DN4570_c0_g1~~TRINITY_DN4570_c0_g1_i2.p1  ORF type:complete len:259 (+),score=59.18 TRINITY_DN4570_c0_g1_i2:198-974(+)
MNWKSSTEDESGISFHDTVWTSKFGLPTPPDVLTYFSMSSFYDRTCNNEVIKMQQLPMEKMREMKGIEYQVVDSNPPFLYVIRKQHRESPDEVHPLATYYIINGVVYPSPSIQAVLTARITTSLYHFQQAIDSLRDHVQFNYSKPHTYDFIKQAPQVAIPVPTLRAQAERNNRVLELAAKIPQARAEAEERKQQPAEPLPSPGPLTPAGGLSSVPANILPLVGATSTSTTTTTSTTTSGSRTKRSRASGESTKKRQKQ